MLLGGIEVCWRVVAHFAEPRHHAISVIESVSVWTFYPMFVQPVPGFNVEVVVPRLGFEFDEYAFNRPTT